MVHVLPTTVVGSYPQPDWLVDRAVLGSRLPPRTRALEIWRPPAEPPGGGEGRGDNGRGCGRARGRTGPPNPRPRVVGPIRRTHAVEVRDVQFLRANTDHQIKATLPGP